MTRNPPRSAKSNAGDRKGVSENASRDALSGRIGLFGRAIRPARSTTRGSEAEIAWKVAFGCFSLTGGKPNGECRFNLRIWKWVAPIQALSVPKGCSTVQQRSKMLNNIGLPGLIIIIVFAVGIWAALSKTGKGKIFFKNPHNGRLREAPIGFSWTTLFFGPFPALFRGHWVGVLVILLVTLVTYGLAGLIFPFFYNKWYVGYLIEDGYRVASADRDVDEISKYLGRELPLIETG